MKIQDLIKEYAEGERTAISVIRLLSGAFNPDHAVDILALVCAVSRAEEGDLDKETLKKMVGINE